MGIITYANAEPPLPTGGLGAHKYWRFWLTNTLIGQNSGVPALFASLQYRIAAGIPAANPSYVDVGTSSQYAAFSPWNLIDADPNTMWAPAQGVGFPQWVTVQFTVAQDFQSLAIQASSNAAHATYAPESFDVEYSDDGSSWTPVKSFTSPGSWGASEWREFILI